MAGVGNEQNDLMRLLYGFNIVTFTSLFTTLLLALFIKEDNIILLTTINAASLSLLVYFSSTLFNGLITWIFAAEFIFMLLVQLLPDNTDILPAMLLISCISMSLSLLVGLVSFSFLEILFICRWCWMKRFPGTADFGMISAEKQLMILECVSILFINGWTIFCGWLILAEVWYTSSFMQVGFPGLLSFFCCVCRLVYKWKEYHRVGAVVSSLPSTTKAAV